MKLLILFACLALSRAALLHPSGRKLVTALTADRSPEPISPYAFVYSADAPDGSSARQETADASGVVRGSYSLATRDGIKRVVTYVADQHGFRAHVDTNEPGTESKSSADASVQSSQPPAEEIARKFGPRVEQQLSATASGQKAGIARQPIGFDVQQKEEFSAQKFESF